jgi:hypothetical protein
MRFQDPIWSDQQILKIVGANSKQDAVSKLRDQSLPDILLGLRKKSHFYLTTPKIQRQVKILGSWIAIDDIKDNWHRDWKNGGEWLLDWHWKVRKVRFDGSDVKMAWELSRCQYLVEWAKVYAHTGDAKIAEQFVALLVSWIDANPIGRGVNWTCAMEAAIRAANWLLVFSVFRSAAAVSDEFLWTFYKSIYAHGRFIEYNLEGPGWYAANHYLADMAGLFYIGTNCPAFKNDSLRWMNLATSELEREIRRQILSDGACFEQSTSYHRLSFELFFYTYWLAQHNKGYKFSKGYLERLRKMLNVVDAIKKPNGETPQIGDNDSGQFFKLEEQSTLDHRYLLDYGVTLLDMRELKTEDREIKESARILGGPIVENTWRNTRVNCDEKPEIRSLPDAGWYILKLHPWWVVVSAGTDTEKSHSGHAHEDRLSIEVSCCGCDVIVDPGTYVYTPHPFERQRFKSARYHNRLFRQDGVNGKKSELVVFPHQNPLPARVLDFKQSETYLKWSGELMLGAQRWLREVCVTLEKCVVTDQVSQPGEVYGSLNFHPNVGLRHLDAKKSIAVLVLKTGYRIAIRFDGVEDIRIKSSWYSQEYGLREKTFRLIYKIASNQSGFCLERVHGGNRNDSHR